MLTPDDVHDVVFAKARRRQLGYDETEVDDFLDRVVATLVGADELTAHDVLAVEFSPGEPGGHAYKKEQVDAFLERVALTLLRREATGTDEDRRSIPVQQPVRELVVDPPPEPLEPPTDRIAVPDPQRDFLDKAEVDAFLDRVEATLRGADWLSSQDLLNARFNPPAPGFPGYPESSVIAFLLMAANSIKQLTLRPRASAAPRPPIERAFPPSRARARGLTPDDIANVVLSNPPHGQCGYDEAAVDHFLDRVEATLRGTDALTKDDVRSVVFPQLPPLGGGYDPDEVDALLDLIEEHLDPTTRASGAHPAAGLGVPTPVSGGPR